MNSNSRAEKDRELIARQTAEFLARGGKVEKVASDVMKKDGVTERQKKLGNQAYLSGG